MNSSPLILLFVLTQLNTNKDKYQMNYSSISNQNHSSLEAFKPIADFLSSVEIDPIYTKEKIRIMGKIGPYLPEKYIGLVNQSMLNTERILKINELLGFLNEGNKPYIDGAIAVSNTKDRINKIVKIVQKETSNSNNKEIGIIMDLVVNMDKYKKMFVALNTLMNNDNPMEHPDQLINMMLPIFGEDENNGDKIKELSKIMEIVKVLNNDSIKDPNDKINI